MEVPVERKFPTPWTLKMDAGVVVPIPTNPLGSTMNKGLEVPMSPTTNTGDEVDCSSMENVPQGEVVPIPTLPIRVESRVRMGMADVEVAKENAFTVLERSVVVERLA